MRMWMKLLGVMLVSILALPLASAQELELYINKHTFEPGDKINVTANILNPLPQELIFRSILFYEGKGDFPPRLQSFMVNKFEEKTIELYSIEVKDSFPSGKYSVIASLVQNGNVLTSKNLTFEIINTKPDFEFEILTCRDRDCFNKSKVFVRGEFIYLDYISEISNPKINATLSYPDGSKEQISLPISIRPQQIGTYTLNVKVSKEGYRTQSFSVQFTVIEKEPKIEKKLICNENGICEPENGENYGTCPQDCPSGSKDNYCDKVEDGICDPDCLIEEDIDCKEKIQITQNKTTMKEASKKAKTLITIIVGIIGIIVIFLIIKFLK